MPVVVNETFARRFFAGESPLGKRIVDLPIFRTQTAKDLVIVGVAGDFRQHELEREPELMVYMPLAGAGSPVVRSRTNAAPLVPVMQGILATYNPNRPPPEVKTVEQRFSEALSQRRFNAVLIGVFAFLAMFLAAIGIYGVMSYLVTLRAREVGVRIALGARASSVLAMIVREGAVLGVIGAAAGLAGAAGLNRYLTSLLVNVSPYDPSTFVTFTAVLLGAVVAASYFPARRAAHTDPLIALRHE
jgi:putative ABC transport system permease protein